jgi:predicted RNA-binding protein YlqC (UPF0109 family)
MTSAADDLVHVVRLLVDDPKAVEVEVAEIGDETELRLTVAENDRGKVIGRRGRTIDALRGLAEVRGERDERAYAVELPDD